jgi:hypothetical protein
MKKVFLSYARLDLRQARRLCADLRKFPALRVWFDKDDLLPGMRWRPAIRKAIRESDYFIALMSKQSVAKRGFRQSELRQALEVFEEFPDDQIFLIPTRFDNCRPPLEDLEAITYADLFPEWDDGVELLGRSMGVRKSPAVKGKPARRKISSKKTRKAQYHYKVGLVDLDADPIKLQTLARGLNSVQRFFHFSPKHLAASRAARRVMDGAPQLDLDRIPTRFYTNIGPMEKDYVVCLTRRYLTFEEDDWTHYNYLGSPSEVDERVTFVSIGGLEEYAAKAGITFDAALAYIIVSQLAGYFVDIEYHDALRGCPWDFTEEHADMVKGLRQPKICSACERKLGKNPELARALRDMLRWGR